MGACNLCHVPKYPEYEKKRGPTEKPHGQLILVDKPLWKNSDKKIPRTVWFRGNLYVGVNVRIRFVPDRCNPESCGQPRRHAGHSQTREGKRSRPMCRVISETPFSLPKPVCTLNARQCFHSFLSVCLIIAYFRPLVKGFCKLFPNSANLLPFIRHYPSLSYQFRKNIEKVRIIR